jgi:hypothetical protein
MGFETSCNMRSRLPCAVFATDFRPLGETDLSPDGLGEKLVSEAHTQKGAPHVHDEPANGFLLGAQPSVLVFLPHILRAAHDDHEIVWLKIGKLLPLVELDSVPVEPILPKEVPKDTRMLVNDMLKNEYFHGWHL